MSGSLDLLSGLPGNSGIPKNASLSQIEEVKVDRRNKHNINLNPNTQIYRMSSSKKQSNIQSDSMRFSSITEAKFDHDHPLIGAFSSNNTNFQQLRAERLGPIPKCLN